MLINALKFIEEEVPEFGRYGIKKEDLIALAMEGYIAANEFELIGETLIIACLGFLRNIIEPELEKKISGVFSKKVKDFLLSDECLEKNQSYQTMKLYLICAIAELRWYQKRSGVFTTLYPDIFPILHVADYYDELCDKLYDYERENVYLFRDSVVYAEYKKVLEKCFFNRERRKDSKENRPFHINKIMDRDLTKRERIIIQNRLDGIKINPSWLQVDYLGDFTYFSKAYLGVWIASYHYIELKNREMIIPIAVANLDSSGDISTSYLVDENLHGERVDTLDELFLCKDDESIPYYMENGKIFRKNFINVPIQRNDLPNIYLYPMSLFYEIDMTIEKQTAWLLIDIGEILKKYSRLEYS